ncbi:hypothetical protein FA95DRAFT_107438 [Auriscalpium vulgare]|uniref:Uncharacterized protein n=1 Tax=Auriscalpium vulgare TaxID=40419 RepID=A0ACB8S721_9AGAM|nr:hypothetical protein FA95DRAFT_107438 [Auriscalpium vulgare]
MAQHNSSLGDIGTHVADVERAVKYELRHSAFVDTPKLLDTLFGDDTVPPFFIDAIYNALVAAKKYIPATGKASAHWAGLPLKPKDEKVLYEPLTKVLNEITAQCHTLLAQLGETNTARRTTRSHAALSNEDLVNFCREAFIDKLDIIWRDEHATAPKSDPTLMSDMRPDIVATFKTTGTGRVWWRTVHIPLEVKQANTDALAAIQLLRYVRQALREQPDRRFMYGLVFAKRTLTVWHVDRSGAMGSKVVDAHENPKTFIRIIVALLVKRPSDLGWDPTMLLYQEDSDGNPLPPLPSYLVDRIATSSMDAYETRWVISMDKPPTKGGGAWPAGQDQDVFVLYQALSLARGEVIRGRATRVWRAWHWDDLTSPEEERRIFVIKDTWRDERRGVEGALYQLAEQVKKGRSGVADFYSHCVVRINNQEDNTLFLIRKRVEPTGTPIVLELAQMKAKQQSATASSQLTKIDSAVLPVSGTTGTVYDWEQDHFIFDQELYPPRNLIHSRLAVTSTGWPLVKFRNISELLMGIRDAIGGHRWLCKRGILHRDISHGNILLTGLQPPNSAMLIDLDHAIEYQAYEHMTDDVRSVGTLAFMSYEVISSTAYPIKSEAADRVYDAGAPSTANDEDEEDDEDGAPDEPNEIIDDTHLHEVAKAAVEPLPVPVLHSAIHDLESFFWVLCFIGLYCDGPGRPRTTWNTSPERSAGLRKFMREAFEQPNPHNIALEKYALMTDPRVFELHVVSNFAPYFSVSATSAVRLLYQLLRTVYARRELDDKHDSFMQILKTAGWGVTALQWHDTNPEYRQMEEEAKKWRQEKKATWDSPSARGLLPVPDNKRGHRPDADDGEHSPEGEDALEGRPRKIPRLPSEPPSPTPGSGAHAEMLGVAPPA